jgi:hypothetical protein
VFECDKVNAIITDQNKLDMTKELNISRIKINKILKVNIKSNYELIRNYTNFIVKNNNKLQLIKEKYNKLNSIYENLSN